MVKLVELRNVLLNVADLCWKDSIFLSKDKDWSLNSLYYLFNLEDLEEGEEIPQFVINNNLDYVLSIADLQDIVDNSYQQHPQCSESELFDAFLYYYKNDAFIIFAR